MGATSKSIESLTLLVPTLLSVLLSAAVGVTAPPVEWANRSPLGEQGQVATGSGSKTSYDAEVKAVLEKMTAAGITQPATVADVRKAYLFYPKLSGTPEQVFRIEDRQIPGPAGNLTIRIYSSKPASGSPILVFF